VLTIDQLGRVGDVAALARRTRRIAVQSVLAGMGLSLAAMGAAAAGLLPVVWGALLQEAIDVAVILNALRALRPPASDVRMTAAHTALTRRFRTEHQAIRTDIEELRITADTLDAPGAMTRVRRIYDKLTREVWPHESAEETELYPSLNRLLGGVDPTAPMSRAHAEIAYQIARLGRLIEEIGTGTPDETDTADLRSLLYGLHAILKLHTVQEDETYLALCDSTDVVAAREPALLPVARPLTCLLPACSQPDGHDDQRGPGQAGHDAARQQHARERGQHRRGNSRLGADRDARRAAGAHRPAQGLRSGSAYLRGPVECGGRRRRNHAPRILGDVLITEGAHACVADPCEIVRNGTGWPDGHEDRRTATGGGHPYPDLSREPA